MEIPYAENLYNGNKRISSCFEMLLFADESKTSLMQQNKNEDQFLISQTANCQMLHQIIKQLP